jgi:multiple sugar transport system substrate-binding protein
LTQLRALFPSTVEDDFADASGIYALPLSLDTLALFYNKDIFDRAALTAPPATWDEVLIAVARTRATDNRGDVTRAAVALGGTSRTVENAPDILQLLLLQNGAQMVLADGATAGFGGSGASRRSVEAFNFYLQFADTGSSAYTWNESMPAARAAFVAGKVAMILDYRSALAGLLAQSPFLRVGVAPVPQVSRDATISFPRYKGLAVSRQSRQASWAWDFVVQAATNPAVVEGYLAATGNPPALRGAIATKLGDPDLDVFARQALTARSWRAPGTKQSDEVFDEAIQSVLTGQADTAAALARANDKMTQLLQSR